MPKSACRLWFFITWLVWLSSCSTAPPIAGGQRLILTDDTPNFRYTLTVTTHNASDESGSPRDGTLTIITTHTPTGQRQDISATGQITPNWLRQFAGQVSIATTPTERWRVTADCRSDASGLPLITMREVLGPLPGFRVYDNQFVSDNGAPIWQAWAASAIADSNGIIQSATGHGNGPILIPGGDVIRGNVSWDYHRTVAPDITIPAHGCNDDVLTALPLPDSWVNRRMYGGALLAESPQAPAHSATDLRDTLVNNGWQITTLDTHTTPIVIQASSQSDTIHVFIVSNQNNDSDITIITVTP